MPYKTAEDARLRSQVDRTREAFRLATSALERTPKGSSDYDSVAANSRTASEQYRAAVEAHLDYIQRELDSRNTGPRWPQVERPAAGHRALQAAARSG